MPLIEYIEPFNAGTFFTGIGTLIVMIVFAWILYRLYLKIIQYMDVLVNREVKYEILEESFLDKIGKEKGIDLHKELVKRKIFEKSKKSFRRKIEEQMYEEMFGKEEKK